MLAINANSRCFVCLVPQDFRKGIDGIAGVVRQKIQEDPMNGAFYLFRNQSRTSIKVLFYGGIGYWLCQLRLSSGRLRWWPEHRNHNQEDLALICQLSAREIQVMLCNGDPTGAQFIPEWKKVNPL
jgi:hypothetical protein